MNHTADQIVSPASERVEVSGSVGQWLELSGMPERVVRTTFVVVGLVLSQPQQEMSVIPDQGALEQFESASADPPLRDRVGRRRRLQLIQMIGTGISG